jgi:hypothetical protein
MKPAAIGVKMHSGWGILVAVSGSLNPVEIVERRRIAITDPTIPRPNQPYHHAATLGLPEAERHLVRCTTVSERLSSAAISEAIEAMAKRNYRVVGAALLLASGRSRSPEFESAISLGLLRPCWEMQLARYKAQLQDREVLSVPFGPRTTNWRHSPPPSFCTSCVSAFATPDELSKVLTRR